MRIKACFFPNLDHDTKQNKQKQNMTHAKQKSNKILLLKKKKKKQKKTKL
jgi:hypothetical protein